jgi:hypothetical protein
MLILETERPPRFNVFDLLKIEGDEVRYSSFLAWLFDPKGGHKEGGRFLSAFLNACHPPIAIELPKFYEVRTEQIGDESRIDISIYRYSSFLIHIENKVYSPEGRGQLAAEFRDLERMSKILHVPEDRTFGIFLTPAGRAPQTDPKAERWHTISYPDINHSLKENLSNIREAKVRYLLEDWLELISRLEVFA